MNARKVSNAAPADIAASRSVGELIGDLTDGSAQLVREEIRLARAETTESLMALKSGAVVLGTGLVLGIVALGAGVSALIMAMAEYLLGGRTWLAALIVAGVLGIVALILAVRGTGKLAAANLAPRETATSLKETATWLRHPTRSDGR